MDGRIIKRLKIALITLICIFSCFVLFGNILAFSAKCKEKEGGCAFQKFVPAITFGLDLRGGSQLLLEIDFGDFIGQNLRSVAKEINSTMWDQRVGYENMKIGERSVTLDLRGDSSEKFNFKIFKSSLEKIQKDFVIRRSKNTIFIEITKDREVKMKDEVVEQLLHIIRSRIDESGTKEILLQRVGANKVSVQVPGIDDPEYVKRMLGKVAKLTFHLLHPVRPTISEDELEIESGYVKLSPYNNSEFSTFSFNVKEDEEMDGNSILDARAINENFKAGISFRLNNSGAVRFANVTAKNIGRPLAIVIDNKVVTSPVINGAIVGGSGMISGNFSMEEARELARLLKSGALPVPLKIIEERTVGPSLGVKSIKSAAMAGTLGIVSVVLFMSAYYRFMGIIASFGLLINLATAVCIMALFNVTLTLSGIAGLILTLGMSIDANVLIYERMRDEVRKKAKSRHEVIRNGFQGALVGIIDSNVTTVLSAITMVAFGSGFIRGFATSLIIGIVCSLFSAVTFTKLIIDYFYIKLGFKLKLD